MSNNLVVIPQINLDPAILAQFADLGAAPDDLSQGVSQGFPVMSIRGAKWRMVEGGEESPIYISGTEDLAPSVEVVLLRANSALSKTYYEGQYVEGADAQPDCSSNDSIAPSPDSPKPQSTSCATCLKNVWGSKISPSGAKIKACADVRRMAVLPAADLEYSPILLRVPGASLSDLAAYGKALKSRGIPYQAVVTKLSFDPDASFPKIMFKFLRVLSPAELATIGERMADPVLEDVLGLNAPRGTVIPIAMAQEADKFDIPADASQQAAAAGVKPDADLEAAVAKVEAAAPAKATPKKAKGFGAAAPAAAQAESPKPAAQSTSPAANAELAPTASGAGMLDDINSALAALDM